MNPVNSICIVGGGSAGWLTAALLRHNLPQAKIQLIESANIPIIGVGEATLLSFLSYMENCGFKDEVFWMNQCEAIYKSGILFQDWGIIGNKIWHPFSSIPYLSDKLHLADCYLDSSFTNNQDYFKYCAPYFENCVLHNKVSAHRGYHLNAVKLAQFLAAETTRKIQHRFDEVEKVNLDHDGKILSLSLKSGTSIQADLFIDCTGFSRSITSQVSGSTLVDKSNFLFCDRAVACPIEYEDKEKEMTPYTLAHSQGNGWIWKTPIAERIGSGLVYDSNLMSPSQAEEHFVSYWGEKRIMREGLRHIKFQSYYEKFNWRKNCLSIGLSGGFVEPLESSGLALITEGALSLLGRIRKGYYTKEDQDLNNSRMTLKYEETFDFVSMHYHNSKRDEPFWQKCREKIATTDSLKYRLEQLSENFLHDYQLDEGTVFGTHSWINLFVGLNFQIPRAKGVFLTDQADAILIDQYKKNEKFKYIFHQNNYELLRVRQQ